MRPPTTCRDIVGLHWSSGMRRWRCRSRPGISGACGWAFWGLCVSIDNPPWEFGAAEWSQAGAGRYGTNQIVAEQAGRCSGGGQGTKMDNKRVAQQSGDIATWMRERDGGRCLWEVCARRYSPNNVSLSQQYGLGARYVAQERRWTKTSPNQMTSSIAKNRTEDDSKNSKCVTFLGCRDDCQRRRR